MQADETGVLTFLPHATKHRGRILIVDDEQRTRLALCSCLEAEGYEVEEARDGAEAIRVILDSRPDLMLLDLYMPHMDGMQALHELRSRYRDVMPRVIVLTANNLLADQEEAMLQGIAEFLAKPIAPELLRRTLARVLGEAEAGVTDIHPASLPASLIDPFIAAENYLG